MSLRTRLWLGALCALSLGTGAAPARAAPNHPLLFEIAKFSPEAGLSEYLEGPCGAAVDSAANLYVSDYYHDQVLVFGPSGSYKTRIAPIDPEDGPCALALEGAGRLYVNNLHRGVIRFAPQTFPPAAGTPYGTGTVIDPGPATGVAVDPATGNVFVDRRTYIAAYDSAGAQLTEGGEPLRIGLGTLADGYGLAVSAYPATAGRLYVADAAAGAVKAYDAAVDPVNPVAVIEARGAPQGGFASLADAALALDRSNGHLFVLENLQGEGYQHPQAALVELNAAAEYRGALPQSAPLFFSEPSGLALDNSAAATQGRVYVTSGNGEKGLLYAYGKTSAAQRLALSLSGTGAGTVRSAPAGIACPPACAAEYSTGATVVLSADPEPGSAFGGWSGGGCAGTGACQLTLGADTALGAEFEAVPESGAPGGGGQAALLGAAPLAPPARIAPPPLAAASEVSRKGTLQVTVEGKMAPHALPRAAPAPIAVSLAGQISTSDGSDPPQLRRLAIEINRHGRLDHAGLPVCRAAQIQPASSARALAACRDSLVGRGRFWADIVLSGQEPYPTQGRLLLFNGEHHGRPALLGQIYAPHPFATSFLIPFELRRLKRGAYGTALIASLPEALGEWGYLSAIEIRLSRRYRYRGEPHSYLSAACPAPAGFQSAPFALARARFSFAGGRELTSTLTRSCAVR